LIKLLLGLGKTLFIILAILAQDGFTKRKCLVGLLHFIYGPCPHFHSILLYTLVRFFMLDIFAAKRINFIILVAVNKSLFEITIKRHLPVIQRLY
jgi:hypothetical protein